MYRTLPARALAGTHHWSERCAAWVNAGPTRPTALGLPMKNRGQMDKNDEWAEHDANSDVSQESFHFFTCLLDQPVTA